MRSAIAFLLALTLGIAGPSLAAPPKKKDEFASADQILRWINSYRNQPAPDKVPTMVRAASALGLFRDLETAGVYVGFTAGIIEANPKRAEALITKMFPMPPEDQVVLVRAIAYSGHPGWKDLLAKFSERMPARKVLIDRFVTGKLPTLKGIPLDSGPAPLDMLWGQYFATGSYDPVLRMVSILEWAKDANNVERLTVGSMAKLTLATNASRDKHLLDMLKASMGHEKNKDTRAVLSEVIEAAETFEFGKVRRDAMASIDQLKTKGPASARNTLWWGQAGQTVLALGCVTAAALGQVQIGIPCIVGGAASSAALKYMVPNQ
jgi:hypothetical protein